MTRNAQSAQKQDFVRTMLSQKPVPTGGTIVAAVKKKFGEGIGTDTIWRLRKDMGLTKGKKPGPKPGGKRKRRATKELVDLLRGGQEADSVAAALAVLNTLLPLPAESQRRIIMGVQVLLGQV
jgi:hypothetical protein